MVGTHPADKRSWHPPEALEHAVAGSRAGPCASPGPVSAALSADQDGRSRLLLRAGRDLPEVAVRVAEVPEVPPSSGSRFLYYAATGRHSVAHDLVLSLA